VLGGQKTRREVTVPGESSPVAWLALTLATRPLGYVNLGQFTIILAVLFMMAKGGLIVSFFMDAKYEPQDGPGDHPAPAPCGSGSCSRSRRATTLREAGCGFRVSNQAFDFAHSAATANKAASPSAATAVLRRVFSTPAQ
jgi:hypothetical protein